MHAKTGSLCFGWGEVGVSRVYLDLLGVVLQGLADLGLEVVDHHEVGEEGQDVLDLRQQRQ